MSIESINARTGDFPGSPPLAENAFSRYTVPMYKMMGADSKEYGPVPAEKVREWITQGRANGQTLVSFEGSPWKPLSTYPEFADVLRSAVPPPMGQPAYAGAPGYPEAKPNGFAIAGLIFSILGVLQCCGVFGSGLGLIFAIIAYNQISNTPQAYSTTKTMPIVAMALAILGILIFVVLLVTGTFAEMIGKMEFRR